MWSWMDPAMAGRFAAMDRFRTRFAHLFLFLGLATWVVGLGARQLHAFESVHTICPEHGELIDMEPGSAQAHAATAQISAEPAAEDHGHDCALQAVVTFATVITPVPVVTRGKRIPLSSPDTRSDPARGPPLAYAPKTSPPLA